MQINNKKQQKDECSCIFAFTAHVDTLTTAHLVAQLLHTATIWQHQNNENTNIIGKF